MAHPAGEPNGEIFPMQAGPRFEMTGSTANGSVLVALRSC